MGGLIIGDSLIHRVGGLLIGGFPQTQGGWSYNGRIPSDTGWVVVLIGGFPQTQRVGGLIIGDSLRHRVGGLMIGGFPQTQRVGGLIMGGFPQTQGGRSFNKGIPSDTGWVVL